MTAVPPFVCNDTAVELRDAIDDFPAPARWALRSWLIEHGVDPRLVADGTTIERLEADGAVQWREMSPEGVVVRTKFPPVVRGEADPAPFPSELTPRPARELGACASSGGREAEQSALAS